MQEEFDRLEDLDSLKKQITDLTNEIDELQQKRANVLAPTDNLLRKQNDLKLEENQIQMNIKTLTTAEQQRRTHLMNIDMVGIDGQTDI